MKLITIELVTGENRTYKDDDWKWCFTTFAFNGSSGVQITSKHNPDNMRIYPFSSILCVRMEDKKDEPDKPDKKKMFIRFDPLDPLSFE